MKIFEDWLIESHPSTWQGDGYYSYRGGRYKNRDDYNEYHGKHTWPSSIKSECIKRTMKMLAKFGMIVDKQGKKETYAHYKIPFTINGEKIYIVFADEDKLLDAQWVHPVTKEVTKYEIAFLVCKFVRFEDEHGKKLGNSSSEGLYIPTGHSILERLREVLNDVKLAKSVNDAMKKFTSDFKTLFVEYDNEAIHVKSQYGKAWGGCHLKIHSVNGEKC